MKLVFICPETRKTFVTEDFSLVDNRGVATDIRGKKVLQAAVLLNSPCPYCRKVHRYSAEELACPFIAG